MRSLAAFAAAAALSLSALALPAQAQQSANIFEVGSQAQAQRQQEQPLNNAPVWRDVNSEKVHRTTLPQNEGGRLIQSEGEQWRQLRNGPVTLYGGWVLVGVVVLLALFYLVKGPIRVNEPPTGRMIERFTALERAAHWTTAITFVILAVSGLVMLFGKYVLLPVFGYALFGLLAAVSKNVHNFVGPLFTLSIIVTFLVFVRDNLPKGYDWQWIRRGAGLFGHAPAHRFNAGEKLIFWFGLTLLGIVVSVSGFVLNFPNFEQTRNQMQFAWTWHAIAALVFIAIILGHIYLGTIGQHGAYRAMRYGWVDEAWAKEHHEYWYEDIKAGRIPAVRSGAARAAAGGPAGAATERTA